MAFRRRFRRRRFSRIRRSFRRFRGRRRSVGRLRRRVFRPKIGFRM